jgi:hypothetical protein
MSDYPEIAARFKRETARHEMTVLHDDGLYRHVRFQKPGSGLYWFDLVTWPGTLVIRGDINDAYVFTRIADMFEFFRGRNIDPGYWSEKLDGDRDRILTYNQDLFERQVKDYVAAAIRDGSAPRGIGREVTRDIFEWGDITHEASARAELESFSYEGFRFKDTWEWNFRDWDWSFLWACHAIVWGIARYDKVARYGLASLAARKQVA